MFRKWKEAKQRALHLAGMTNLEFVGLTKTFVTDAGVAKLMKALPKCSIF